MIAIGAIIKSIADTLEGVASAAERGLKAALGGRRPKPCPIYVQAEDRRRR